MISAKLHHHYTNYAKKIRFTIGMILSNRRPKILLYLINGEHKNTRVHRWAIELMEYEFEIIHREGKLNYGADALSRIKIDDDRERCNEIMSIEQCILSTVYFVKLFQNIFKYF